MLTPVAEALILLLLTVAENPVELTAVAPVILNPSTVAPLTEMVIAAAEGLLMIDSAIRVAEPAVP